MDLSIKSETFGADDPSWLASRDGLGSLRSITLDLSAFTKNTHYPDGFLKSGLPLARRTADGLYVPYDTSGSGGADVLDGHLFGHITVSSPLPTPAKFGASLFWRGVVDARWLPAAVDAAGRADVAGRSRYENVGS